MRSGDHHWLCESWNWSARSRAIRSLGSPGQAIPSTVERMLPGSGAGAASVAGADARRTTVAGAIDTVGFVSAAAGFGAADCGRGVWTTQLGGTPGVSSGKPRDAGLPAVPDTNSGSAGGAAVPVGVPLRCGGLSAISASR
jgi:hypothetical protein